MGETFHECEMQKSRRRRQCTWCAIAIEIGEPYRAYSWRDGGMFGRVQMHPECYAAMLDVATEEGGWLEWSVGDFHRGCGCASGDCECGDFRNENSKRS
jgi:hypothetical protein